MMRARRLMAAIVIAALYLVAPARADLFSGHWSDGLAELDGYDLIQPRYGELRHGRAVLVFVTEPYSRSRQVKVDRHDATDPDQLTVLKLNSMRKFQTGIYDYSAMTSVFVDPGAGFAPLKVTFSMQEWCGHVFEDARFGSAKVDIELDSYFEGESGARSLTAAAGFVAEDVLPIQLRTLAAKEVRRADGPVSMLSSALQRRLTHKEPALLPSRITWSRATRSVTVPAGTFEVLDASYDRPGGACSYQIEVVYPHRIVSWSCGDGEKAVLTGSTRLDYWRTHAEGDEKLLEKLGLRPAPYKP